MITLITDRKLLGKGFFKRLQWLIHHDKIDQIILREKDLEDDELYELYLEIKKRIKMKKIKLIVNASLDFAVQYKVRNIHFSQKNFDSLKDIPKDITFGVSVHNKAEVIKALVKKPDYLLISPVFKSSCKPGVESLGLDFIKSIRSMTETPLIVLGGITPSEVVLLKAEGFWNVAMRSYLLQKNVIDICL